MVRKGKRGGGRRGGGNGDGAARRTPASLVGASPVSVEPGPHGEDHLVRPVPAARALKRYRCPGCDHEIMPGVAHIVAWPAPGYGDAEDRRHWHTGCWRSRRTRTVTRRWS